MVRSNALVGGAAALLGAAVYWNTLSFPKLPDGTPGPSLFPQILSVLLVVSGLILILESRRSRTDEAVSYQGIAILKAGGVLVGVAAYIVLVERLGFLLTSGLLLAGLMLMLNVRVRIAIPVAVVVAVGCVILFEKILRVPLPPGLLRF